MDALTAHRPKSGFAGAAAAGVLLALVPTVPAQTTRHVAPCGNNAWTGLSPVCAAPNGPKRTIQAAVNASVHGDTVLVAAGTYLGPGNRDIEFGGRNITLRSQSGAAGCILDAQGSETAPHRVFHLRSGETRAARIEGFTITRGYALGAGAGMLLEGASPTVVNCVFRFNGGLWHPARGGAVATIGGDPLFLACWFKGNTAALYDSGKGGGVSLAGSGTFKTCGFVEHAAASGGAVHAASAAVTMVACRVENNSAYEDGGGVMTEGGVLTLTRCTVAFNTAEHAGAIYASGADIRLNASNITDNDSFLSAGAIYSSGSLDMRACRVLRNGLQMAGGGGAITGLGQVKLSESLIAWNDSLVGACALDGAQATVTIRGCTIAENGPSPEGCALWLSPSAVVANSVIWANAVPRQLDGSASVRYSLVQGGHAGLGNRDADPLFVGANFRPGPGSPCIDAGSNPEVTPGVTLDLDQKPRFRNDHWMPDVGVGPPPVVDIGAYEFIGSSCRPDCNSDAALTSADMACFEARFQQQHPYADYNRDGAFNTADFAAFNAAFAAGCP